MTAPFRLRPKSTFAQRPLQGNDRLQFLIEEIGIHEQLAHELPPDVATPPPRPVGLMQAYLDDAEKTAEVMRDGYYHTGDAAGGE